MCDLCTRIRKTQGCPTCGAPPGRRCITKRGDPVRACDHVSRGGTNRYQIPPFLRRPTGTGWPGGS